MSQPKSNYLNLSIERKEESVIIRYKDSIIIVFIPLPYTIAQYVQAKNPRMHFIIMQALRIRNFRTKDLGGECRKKVSRLIRILIV